MSEVKVTVNVNANQAQKNVKGLGDAAGYTTDSMGRLRDESGKFVKTGDDVARSSGAAGKSVSVLGNIFKSTIGQFTIAGIATNAVTSGMARINQAVTEAIQTGAKYQSGLNELAAITGIAGADLNRLGDAAKQNAIETGVAIDQQIEAFKLLASNIDIASIGGVEGLEKLQKEVITLAQASGVDLATAANTVAGTLNQFQLKGEDAARVVNVLAAGSKYGAAEVADLAESMKQAGTTAAQAGQSVEGTVAALEVLSQNALKGAEAGTGLRNVLTILQTETDKLAKAGITNVNLKSEGLSATLSKLTPILGDATTLTDIFGRENLNAAQILIANAKAVEEMQIKVTATNTAMEQAQIQTQGYEAAQRKLNAAYEAASIALFQKLAPAMTSLLDITADLIAPSESLANETERLTKSADSLEKETLPLIKQYETLSAKAVISATEQAELDRILKTLEGQLPITSFQFDKYGKAIGLSTEKAEAWIKQQREVAVYAKKEFYADQIEKVTELAKRLDLLRVYQQRLSEQKNPSESQVERITEDLDATSEKIRNEIALILRDGARLEDVFKTLRIDEETSAQIKGLATEFGVASAQSDAMTDSLASLEAEANAIDLAVANMEAGFKKVSTVTTKAAEDLPVLEARLKDLNEELNNLLKAGNSNAGDLAIARRVQKELDAIEREIKTRQASIEASLKPLEMPVVPVFKTPTGQMKLEPVTVPVVVDTTAFEGLGVKLQGYVGGLQTAGTLTNALSNYASAASAARISSIEKEESLLLKKYDKEEERIRRANDKKLKSIDQQLQADGLSEEARKSLILERQSVENAYEAQLAANAAAKEKQQIASDAKIREAKKKGAEQQKKWAQAEAVINGAVAIIKSWPNPFLIAATTAAVGIQIAAIRKQPIPEFAQGGQIPVKVSNGEYFVPAPVAAKYAPVLSKINSNPAYGKALSAGLIRGAGTGKSDSIYASAQPGSFVVNADSTRAALPFLDAMSQGFAVGGQVGQMPAINLTSPGVNLDPLIAEMRALRDDFEHLSIRFHAREFVLLVDKEKTRQSKVLGV